MHHRSLKTLLLTAVFLLGSLVLTFQQNRVSATPDAAAIYAAKCAKCHGADGTGVAKYKKKGVKDFTDPQWQKSRRDAQLTTAINKGKGEVMPAWSTKLSAEEIKALVGFVRSFAKR